ncbi:MAG: thermonuclease family protein, partial [Hyphomicrobiales bacterium]
SAYPETRNAKCTYEKNLGNLATTRARTLVKAAGRVDLLFLPGKDKYGRHLGKVFVRGQNLGEILISEGLARPYSGGRRKGWC